MTCERCNAVMIERPPSPHTEDTAKEPAIVLECPQCGYSEYQPLIASFWRRLAA